MSSEVIVLKKRKKLGKTIPFGFTTDPANARVLVPDPLVYRHIFMARDMRKAGSTLHSIREYFRENLNVDLEYMNIKRVLERKY